MSKDNKPEIKMISKHAKQILQFAEQKLIPEGKAKDVTDIKYIEEVVPGSLGFEIRLFEVYVEGNKIVNVRMWHDTKIEDQEVKSYVFKVSFPGLIAILTSKTIMRLAAEHNIANGNHLDIESIEKLLNKVFPDAEVVK